MPADQQDFERGEFSKNDEWASDLSTEDDHRRAGRLREQHRKVAALREQLGPAAMLAELREAGHGTATTLDQERAIVWDVLEALRGEQCLCWCEDALCECVMCTFISRVQEWWYELL
jgi:hypothetical protein